jgi:hydroxymethylpyrimidine pyrophosphatase-like HAD family hydrolase
LGDRIPVDLGEISMSADDVLDVVPVGVSKATGLAALGSHLGFGAGDVVAYGDMPNDAPMLEWAALGVSVGGAHPDAVAASDVAIGGPDEDAVAVHLATIFGQLRSWGDPS